ncbi:galactosyltransferase-domain-containing protein [Gymnopilus junonius]|uniref:Hexosyltransferase n=1 Tax=Gymnopilus junonius TaxID=109634 RepID=A0A9P5NKB0_GYMJU|nr:galactosyltransferase-domain-containing protein [Gymnopilus junonius]
MYPPATHYSALPTDPEDIYVYKSKPTWRRIVFTRRFLLGISGSLFIFLLIGFWSRRKLHSAQAALDAATLPEDLFVFNNVSRPHWLDVPLPEPLVLRIAVITRVDAYERRQSLRDNIFRGVGEKDISMVYRFFVGAAPHTEQGNTDRRLVEEENRKHNDIIVLDDIDDIPERISEKRYAAFKWAGSVPNSTYDYFLTVDSDTFVRFMPLARRLPQLYGDKKINPREDPLIIGRMGSHLTYFLPTVPDGNKDEHLQDMHVKGPWFPYPIGIGYMISSALVNIFLSTDPPLTHHIHYPSDDVMIGTWIASLRYFPDKTIEFEEIPKNENDTSHTRFYPEPYLPYAVDTLIINDVPGWHDFPARGGQEGPITWDSICIHRLKAHEMKELRNRPEFLLEWDAKLS